MKEDVSNEFKDSLANSLFEGLSGRIDYNPFYSIRSNAIEEGRINSKVVRKDSRKVSLNLPKVTIWSSLLLVLKES